MKIVTAHVNIKALFFYIFAVLLVFAVALSAIGVCKNKTEAAQTVNKDTELAEGSELRDKYGNPYTPSSNLTVYLTFDDGPSKNTPELLKILEDYGIGATFFVINGKYNSYLKSIAESKSTIALHSYSHRYSEVYSSEKAFLDDLEKIHNLVLSETGIDTKIFRFPGGSSNTVSRKYCKNVMTSLASSTAERGYIYFDWNCDNGDAGGKEISAENQIKKAVKYPQNTENIVILMHDIDVCGVKSEALRGIIDFYQSKGAQFGVITENSPRVCHKINN